MQVILNLLRQKCEENSMANYCKPKNGEKREFAKAKVAKGVPPGWLRDLGAYKYDPPLANSQQALLQGVLKSLFNTTEQDICLLVNAERLPESFVVLPTLDSFAVHESVHVATLS